MAKRVTPWNPNTADWLVAQRGATNQDEIVSALEKLGQRISRSWLSRIENGEPFSQELLTAFQKLYKSVPPPYEPPTTEPDGDLATALLAIAGELKAAREERADVARRLAVMEMHLEALGEMERYLASLPEATRLSLRPKAAAPNHETPAQ